jgi:pyrimidine-nucleoside phosphorylase
VIRPAELIERKRDGGELSARRSASSCSATRDEIPEYQVAAFLMAVYFRGLSGAETFALTDAMIASGDDRARSRARSDVRGQALDGRRRRQDVDRGRADRGGLRRALRKMSGRGLGHTGGTVDKLEAIPGFSGARRAAVRRAGARGRYRDHRTGANLVPADKRLYALRDVTATVDNVSLIAASIMSKKIAGGADAIVLDVKVGDGAVMKTIDDARALAETMIELGNRAGRRVVCMLTDMDQPLGEAVGNALEIREAVDTIKGEGRRTSELVLDASARLALSDLDIDGRQASCRRPSRTAPPSPRTAAGSKRRAAIHARTCCHARRSLRRSRRRERATSRGSAIAVGRAVLHLGAGRRTKDDDIDHAVGVVCRRKRGDAVAQASCSPGFTRGTRQAPERRCAGHSPPTSSPARRHPRALVLGLT